MIKQDLDAIGEFLSKYAEKSEHVYWISSHDFMRIKYISPSYEKIWGRSRQELYDNPEVWISFLHPDDASDHHPIHKMAEKIAIEGEHARYEEDYRIVRPDGSVRWIFDRGFPLIDEHGNCYGVTGIAIDITEQKQQLIQLQKAKQEAEAANRAKSEFIANMSHDIRTPLAGIIGISSILEDEACDDGIKEYAHMLNLSGEQLLSLLNSVLDLVSAGSLGEKKVNLKPFSVKELLNNIYELERPSLTLKEIDFILNMGPEVPDVVVSDKEKVYRILLNILSNAIKFTYNGSITIHVSLAAQKGDDIDLCFKVIDTGIGIPKEDIHKVFDQYYRVTSSYEGNFDGYGVGLHIVREYLDRLNGKVTIDSEVGVGTTIALTIPMKQAAASQTLECELETAFPQKDVNIDTKVNPKNEDAFVLLVEDNFIARTTATTILTKAGCRVMQADTSHSAFELCQKHRFDFILTDIGLPDYSGLVLAEKIHAYEQDHNLPKTPIIGLSSHAKRDVIQDAKKSGMFDLAEKPLKTGLAEKLIYKFGHSDAKQSSLCNNTNKSPEPEKDHPPQLPLLDVEKALSQLGDLGVLKELLQHMVHESMNMDVEAVDVHFNAQDWDAFKKSVHRFKSSCLYCCTTQLLAATTKLEELAQSKNMDELSLAYPEFKQSCSETKAYIEQWLIDNH
ncbi:MAG: response regulator [Legionellaceae bacterium]|nr:response regulator [Legionellaceae bacterium]